MSASSLLRISLVICLAATCACQYTEIDNDSAGTMSPRRPTEADRQRLEQAMAGLLYDDSGVVVDPAMAGQAGWASNDELQRLLDEAEAWLGRGRAIRAIAGFTQAVIAAPDRAEPYEGLGRALIREGKSVEAVASFRTAVRIEPEWLAARMQIGNTLQRIGRHDEAVGVWQEVLASDPDYAEAHASLAATYHLSGLNDLALHHLERALNLGADVPAQLPVMIATGQPPRATVRRGHDAGQASEDMQVQVGPKVRINNNTGGGTADETTCIAIDATPMQAIAAWNSAQGGYRVGAAVTLDGGETWTDFVIDDLDSYCDGMTAGDERTGSLWVGGLSGNLGMFVKKSQVGTTDFDAATIAGYADKPWMTAGRRHDDPNTTRLYITANIDFAYSDDMGQTWVKPGSSAMSGIGHLPRIGPNGELYIAFWDLNRGVKLQRSFNGGDILQAPITIATRLEYWDIYSAPQVPGSFRTPPLTYLAVNATDGTLYCVYFDVTDHSGGNANADLYFTRSTDQGSTWETPWVVNGDSDPPGDQFFPWLEIDSSGRLHMLFYDTRHTSQDDSASSAYLDAYYSWSEDGGDTWTEHRLTATSFNTGAASSFLGDYLGMGVGHGRAYPIYAYVNGSVHEIATNKIVWGEPAMFADSFESGDTSAWFHTYP